jgi:hypothetical protein
VLLLLLLLLQLLLLLLLLQAWMVVALGSTITRVMTCAGIQSLLAVACGWGCGRWGVLQPDPTVAHVNTLVLKFCIPCLQVWLLAIKTDMRQPGSWR